MCAKLFLLFAAVFLSSLSGAGQTVSEADSSVTIGRAAIEVTLAVSSNNATEKTVEIAILDTDTQIKAHLSTSLTFKPGKHSYKLSIPSADLIRSAGDDIAWYRLEYRVGSVSGIASLSELLRDDFDLRAAAFERIVPGESFRLRVHAVGPTSQRPVKGVGINAQIKIDLADSAKADDHLTLGSSGTTDSNGFATFDLAIPRGIRPNGGTITIRGKKNGLVREIQEDLDGDTVRNSLIITADKPLYQPGQTFNARAICMDPSNTVLPRQDLAFSIEDEDGTVLFRHSAATSEFGIASMTWQIPDNTKLGTYRLQIEADDDLRYSELLFKVSRYDLPNFAVTVTPDRSFYLTTDRQAKVTVTADYLFGKPVTHGKVRIVQVNERTWNYRDQKYDGEEGPAVEGSADADGKYLAVLDLTPALEDLKDEEWKRFKDVSYAAYFTDPTTNRTEQRRFDLRLSREPIHVYMTESGDLRHDLPFTGYVSTCYADGRPAMTSVDVLEGDRLIAHVTTNSLGIAKFSFTLANKRAVRARAELSVIAIDKHGAKGTYDDSIYVTDQDTLLLKTDKSIYKPGEMMEVDLLSSRRSGIVYIDIAKDRSHLSTLVAHLSGGRAHVTIPYIPVFKSELTIAAYTDEKEGRYYDDSMRAARGVIFPDRPNLDIVAKFSKAEYRPGEAGAITFSVLDASHHPTEAAIGLGIFDRAIEERARTENEFGSYWNALYSYWGYDRQAGGVNVKDIEELDLEKPISPEMQLAAEMMLTQDRWYFPTIYHSGNAFSQAKAVFSDKISAQMQPVLVALKTRYKKNAEHPTNAASLERILTAEGVGLTTIRDPWGQSYFPAFSVEQNFDILSLTSAGPDKKLGSDDDINALSVPFEYFKSTGEAIERAVNAFHGTTGDFVKDRPTLAAQMAKIGIDLDQLRDRWGHSYAIEFHVAGRQYIIRFHSAGPNGKFEPTAYGSDDFDVWRVQVDFFVDTEQRINRILDEEVNKRKHPFPRDEQQFAAILRSGGMELPSVSDGYGRPVYLVVLPETRYADKIQMVNGKETISPVTEGRMIFELRTRGLDIDNAADDVTLASFSGVITEAYKGTGFAKAEVSTVAYSGAKGAIAGVVTDPAGAVIPGVEVTATDELDEKTSFKIVTDEVGKFLIGNLPAGLYSIRFDGRGFASSVYQHITVRSMSLATIDATLAAGSVSEVVTVTSSTGAVVDATETRNQATTKTTSVPSVRIANSPPMSTPRLREYFPETLLWRPEVLTDNKGRAQVNFKMADNITTWKMFAIASTKNGKVGLVEKYVTAFQPFFVDLDPPKFLTMGDEIYLPSQVRNYTDRTQKVDVAMDKGDWFEFLTGSAQKQQVSVGSASTQNAVFGFKAVRAVKEGKQRVTATAEKGADAIQKAVTVRPDGEEVVRTDEEIIRGTAKFDLDFPANAVPGTPNAELKIYPNLMSHVAGAVEGMLERPYGCGEQTISSTYPDLMILRFAQADAQLRQKADKYLRKGVERLIGYQSADGGFSYWGAKDTPDIALTAYAIHFLSDASPYVEIDESIIDRAQDWLLHQQRADGSWTTLYRWESSESPVRTQLISTYVTRSLAMVRGKSTKENSQKLDTALGQAMRFLKASNSRMDEPYALALFGLSSLDAGDVLSAKETAEKLAAMAIPDGSGVYWKLETNTPFYGWGTAGRIETTALVLQLLAKTHVSPETAAKGLVFLLKNKDRYGVWYSTQGTINVLDAFLTLLSSETSNASKVAVWLNGKLLSQTNESSDRIEPITIDLGDGLTGSNSVEISNTDGSQMMTQLVAKHYVDWRDSTAAAKAVNGSGALTFGYKCDDTTPAVMAMVTCTVDAERVGFKGYGMMLAEIGTPPGADVSRESLEAAMAKDWSVSRYEILPDRVVLYMWAKPGGTHFSFQFRERYRVNAQTPASILYDYYNPEAHATALPVRFRTR